MRDYPHRTLVRDTGVPSEQVDLVVSELIFRVDHISGADLVVNDSTVWIHTDDSIKEWLRRHLSV